MLNRIDLLQKILDNLPDNDSQLITASKLREVLNDLVYSDLNLLDDNSLLGLKVYNTTRTYKLGDSCIFADNIYKLNVATLTGTPPPSSEWIPIITTEGDFIEKTNGIELSDNKKTVTLALNASTNNLATGLYSVSCNNSNFVDVTKDYPLLGSGMIFAMNSESPANSLHYYYSNENPSNIFAHRPGGDWFNVAGNTSGDVINYNDIYVNEIDFENGLTLTGDTATLGGQLTQNTTTITGGGYTVDNPPFVNGYLRGITLNTTNFKMTGTGFEYEPFPTLIPGYISKIYPQALFENTSITKQGIGSVSFTCTDAPNFQPYIESSHINFNYNYSSLGYYNQSTSFGSTLNFQSSGSRFYNSNGYSFELYPSQIKMNLNDQKIISINPSQMLVTDSPSQKGLEYAGNYHLNYNNRSLVDKEYVDNSYTSSNGITKTGTNFKLGGTVTDNTFFTGNPGSAFTWFGIPLTKFGTGNIDFTTHSADWLKRSQLQMTENMIQLTYLSSMENKWTWLNMGADIEIYKAPNNVGTTTGFKKINITNDQILVTDTYSQKGIEYAGNYHANYTNRSLVDKEYVDSVSGSSYTFSNGLTESLGTVKLGGTLTGDTTISGSHSITLDNTNSFTWQNGGDLFTLNTGALEYFNSGSNISLQSSGVQLQHNAKLLIFNDLNGMVVNDGYHNRGLVYANNYHANFVGRSLVDKDYVDSVAAGGGSSYTFSNGLTETTGTVKLGGTLTGDTVVDAGANRFTLSYTDGGLFLPKVGDGSGPRLLWNNGGGLWVELFNGTSFETKLTGGTGNGQLGLVGGKMFYNKSAGTRMIFDMNLAGPSRTQTFQDADGVIQLQNYLGTKQLNTLTPTGVENGYSLIFDSTLDKYKLEKVNDYLKPTVVNTTGTVTITTSDNGKVYLPTNVTTYTLPLWSSVTAPFMVEFMPENVPITINPNATDLGVVTIDGDINFAFGGGYASLQIWKLAGSNGWRIK